MTEKRSWKEYKRKSREKAAAEGAVQISLWVDQDIKSRMDALVKELDLSSRGELMKRLIEGVETRQVA